MDVLVIEDHRPQQAMLMTALHRRGHRVHLASTGAEALDLLRAGDPSVVLLDLGLPDTDGLTLLRHVRAHTDAPVIVVTADDDERTVVQALDGGADDYVVKPFSMPVLLARVRVARRHVAARAAVVPDDLIRVGDVVVDVAAHAVAVAGRPVDVPARQFALLTILARNAGKVVTFSALSRALGSGEPDVDERNAWRVLVSKLRTTLGAGPERPTIVAELHVGYRLVLPDD